MPEVYHELPLIRVAARGLFLAQATVSGFGEQIERIEPRGRFKAYGDGDLRYGFYCATSAAMLCLDEGGGGCNKPAVPKKYLVRPTALVKTIEPG